MEKKHTPGVWKLWETSIYADQDGTGNIDTAVFIAIVPRDVDGKLRTHDAEFIVQACNNYERLQSENEKMREFLEKRKKKLEYMQRANYFSVNDGYELAELQTLLNSK